MEYVKGLLSPRGDWFQETQLDLSALCAEVGLGGWVSSAGHESACATSTNDVIKAAACSIMLVLWLQACSCQTSSLDLNVDFLRIKQT